MFSFVSRLRQSYILFCKMEVLICLFTFYHLKIIAETETEKEFILKFYSIHILVAHCPP